MMISMLKLLRALMEVKVHQEFRTKNCFGFKGTGMQIEKARMNNH